MHDLFENFQVAIDSDGVAVLRLNVAGHAMNVWTQAFGQDLQAALTQLAGRADVRGIVITSARPNAFMAGGDLKDFVGIADRGLGAREAAERYGHGSRVLRQLETCGKPVAAAINGLALGGGLELALACHHRALTDDPAARIGLPEVTVGLLPGAGGTQRLPRMIGIAAALPLMLTGRSLAPAEARAAGIVDALLPAADVLQAARAWVLAHPQARQPWDVKGFQIPGGAGALAPHAAASFGLGVAQLRRDTQDKLPAPLCIASAVYEGTQLPMDRALAVENRYFGQLLVSPVARNLMRTGFLARQAARRRGAQGPHGPRHAPPQRLAVLGAGMMGSGIAQVAAAAGLQVMLLDNTAEAAQQGRQRALAAWERDAKAGRLSTEEIGHRVARILPTADLQQLAGCDVVIEAVFEDRGVKTALMDRAASVLANRGADFIWATNTSTLPVTGLAQTWPRPQEVIGLHFFSPVPRMELVEVILGTQTADATLARALALVARLGKTPIVVRDSPGFFTSRIFCAYIDEGMAMLSEGVAPALIENAARQAGFATGPLAVTDEVSLDLQLRVVQQATADGLDARFLRGHAQEVIHRMNTLGRLGRKSAGGFHDFPPDGPKRLWPGLAALYPVQTQQPGVDAVQQRLLLVQALESARCVEEGVIVDHPDADLGAVLGLGYPSWTGGPLSYIDTLGLPEFLRRCDALAERHGERFRPSAWLRALAQHDHPFHAPAGRQAAPEAA